MSWKSFVSAGLLCILATPVFAQPTLRVTSGGLDVNNNWIWNVSVETGFADSPAAAELGFRTSRPIVSVTRGTEFSGTNTDNPGNEIFGWETLSPLGGSGNCDSGNPGNCPVGLQWHENTPGAPANELFAALGSISENGWSGQTNLLTIVTEGPAPATDEYTIEVLGAYGGGGRIAELTSPTTSANYGGFLGEAIILAGDANLDGAVNGLDMTPFLLGFQAGSGGWADGDFNGDGAVNGLDYTPLALNFGKSEPISLALVGSLPGSGSGGSLVPEPASATLIGLAFLGALGLFRRR